MAPTRPWMGLQGTPTPAGRPQGIAPTRPRTGLQGPFVYSRAGLVPVLAQTSLRLKETHLLTLLCLVQACVAFSCSVSLYPVYPCLTWA